jgi:fluoride exporter
MSLYLWIALGSALGGVARFALSGLVAHHVGETFPWGTLLINVAGSFAIGFFATLTSPDGRLLVGASARHFVMTGILGGFTTYSSFSLQTLNLARAGDWLRAGGNAGGTFLLCFVAVWLGHVCAASFNSLKGS